MYTPAYTRQFSKDLKRAQKRGKSIEKLKLLAQALIVGETPDSIRRDHKLVGGLRGPARMPHRIGLVADLQASRANNRVRAHGHPFRSVQEIAVAQQRHPDNRLPPNIVALAAVNFQSLISCLRPSAMA